MKPLDDLTLRDWFAGQALIATAAQDYGNDWGKDGKEYPLRAARRAYRLADAMIEVQATESKGG